MKRPDRPRVTGALAPHAKGFGIELSRQGYSPWTASEHMYLMADVSRWLDHRGLEPAELNSARIEAFLTDRCARGQGRWTARALVPLFGYLRGWGIVPEPTEPAPASAVGGLLLEFVGYLTNERGLAAGSIAAYRHLAELFLAVCAPDPTVRGCGLKRLEAQHINTFILTECARRSIGSTKNLVNTLRVLMRFLHVEGYTTTSLVESVPRAIPWRDSGRSRALEPEQVSRLLASCDRRTAAGRRDFAILTVLARLVCGVGRWPHSALTTSTGGRARSSSLAKVAAGTGYRFRLTLGRRWPTTAGGAAPETTIARCFYRCRLPISPLRLMLSARW